MAKKVARQSAKSKTSKKASLFKRVTGSSVGLAICIVIALILLPLVGYKIYKVARYHSAPESIKLIRKEKIYNYESDNLKIARRSEDYGGKDWKGAYHEPSVYIRYGVSGDWRKHLIKQLSDYGWRPTDISKMAGFSDIFYYAKSLDDSNSGLSLSFSDDDDSYVTIIIRPIDDGVFGN